MKTTVLVFVENPFNTTTITQCDVVHRVLTKYFTDVEVRFCCYEQSAEIENVRATEKIVPVQSSKLKAYTYKWDNIHVVSWNFIVTLDYDTAQIFENVRQSELEKEFKDYKNIINLNLDKRCLDETAIGSALLTHLVYLSPKDKKHSTSSTNTVDWFAENYEDLSGAFTEIFASGIEKLHKRGTHLDTGNYMAPLWSIALLNAVPTIMMCYMFPKRVNELIKGYELYLKTSKDIKWNEFEKGRLINALNLHFKHNDSRE